MLDSGSNEKCVALLSKASTLLTRMVDKNVCYCRCDWIQPQCSVRLIFACFQERTCTMAIELNTDGNTQTATTGDTAINNSGIYNATLLGATFLWCAGFFGAYVAFTRVVTGVAIDIVGGAKIDIFTGGKLTIQAAAAYTVQAGEVFTLGKIKEMNVQADVMKKITDLKELITSQSRIIKNCTDDIGVLNQTVEEFTRNYNAVDTVGVNSNEEWSGNISISSNSYTLSSKGNASISVDGNSMSMSSSSVSITGSMVNLGD